MGCDFCVRVLKAGNDVDRGVRSVEVVLNKEIVVNNVQHLGPVHFANSLILIQLFWMQKTKLELEGVAFLVNTIRGNIYRKHRV